VCEHIIPDDLVLDVVANTALTACDAEFVALATALSAPLVTINPVSIVDYFSSDD
jgi:predicted nucleic acid-binding protein